MFYCVRVCCTLASAAFQSAKVEEVRLSLFLSYSTNEMILFSSRIQ